MKFKTLKELDQAGYESPGHPRVLGTHRGVEIRMSDTSGSGEFGYCFAVTVRTGSSYNEVRQFAHSKSIYLSEEVNRAHQRGAEVVRFDPGEISCAIDAAREFIDGSESVREYHARINAL